MCVFRHKRLCVSTPCANGKKKPAWNDFLFTNKRAKQRTHYIRLMTRYIRTVFQPLCAKHFTFCETLEIIAISIHRWNKMASIERRRRRRRKSTELENRAYFWLLFEWHFSSSPSNRICGLNLPKILVSERKSSCVFICVSVSRGTHTSRYRSLMLCQNNKKKRDLIVFCFLSFRNLLRLNE